ncbi:MAG TPA: peptide chain release factor 2 [Bacillota bacterium]
MLAESGRKIEELRDSLDLPDKEKQIGELETQAGQPNFWSDQESAQKVVARLSRLREHVDRVHGLAKRHEDLAILAELGREEQDAAIEADLQKDAEALREAVNRAEVATLLSGKYAANDAIVSLHAGAGGTESQDWVEMLLRMYTRWAERHGYDVKIVDILPGEEAGIKSVTFVVSGDNAYGYLRAEKGVHRLVRISPFDSSGRRHTSFASLDAIPEIEDDGDIEIRPEDLKVDTFRSGGKGGQNVNKVETAVRITHLPSGFIVACQTERSQLSNKETALRMLRSKLVEAKEEQQAKELASIRGVQTEIAWGNQIRSYVFQPYTLVKDHRTAVEIGNVQAVMDGGIDPFIYAYLQKTTKAGSPA